MAIKVFHLEREEDDSGISGTGRVAEGIEYSDGTVVVHWLSHTPSTNIYGNMKQVISIHGHEGKTNIVPIWEEEPPVRKEDVVNKKGDSRASDGIPAGDEEADIKP